MTDITSTAVRNGQDLATTQHNKTMTLTACYNCQILTVVCENNLCFFDARFLPRKIRTDPVKPINI